jgi:hypothetical protein
MRFLQRDVARRLERAEIATAMAMYIDNYHADIY